MNKILLVSHQLDYSGAPIALLELARALIGLGHSVALASLTAGPLQAAFAESGVVPYRAGRFDLIVANTVVTVPTALRLREQAPALLAWIHESEYFFQIMRVHPESLGLQHLPFAAFPSRFQVDEFARHMPRTHRMQLRNHVRMPAQATDGAVSDGGYFVCSGQWEPRKNQAALVRLLAAAGVNPRLCFLGATRPATIGNTEFKFTGQVRSDQAKSLIAASRGVISTSLAETQNLVAIEALMAGRPVLLSDIPAHRELKESIPDLLLFRLDDAGSFAAGYRALNEQWQDAPLRTRMRAAAEANFGQAAFGKSVAAILQTVTKSALA